MRTGTFCSHQNGYAVRIQGDVPPQIGEIVEVKRRKAPPVKVRITKVISSAHLYSLSAFEEIDE